MQQKTLILNHKVNQNRIFGEASTNQYVLKPYSIYTGSMFYWQDVLSLPLGDILRCTKHMHLLECDD